MDNLETVEPTGTTGEETADEFPSDVVQMTDEELDRALGESVEDDSEGVSEETTEEPQPEQEEELQDPAEAAEGDEPAKPEPEQANLAGKSREELLAMVQQQERYIKLRSDEIGTLRKEKQELIRRLKERADEIGDEDPRRAAQLDRAVDEAAQAVRELDAEQDRLARLQHGSKMLASRVPPEQFDEQALREELLQVDKLPANFVEALVKNPLEHMEAETAVYMLRSAFYAKNLKKVLTIAKAMGEKLKEHEGNARNASKNAVSKIEKALKSPPTLNGGSGGSVSSKKTIETDPTTLSDAELEELLKEAS